MTDMAFDSFSTDIIMLIWSISSLFLFPSLFYSLKATALHSSMPFLLCTIGLHALPISATFFFSFCCPFSSHLKRHLFSVLPLFFLTISLRSVMSHYDRERDYDSSRPRDIDKPNPCRLYVGMVLSCSSNIN